MSAVDDYLAKQGKSGQPKSAVDAYLASQQKAPSPSVAPKLASADPSETGAYLGRSIDSAMRHVAKAYDWTAHNAVPSVLNFLNTGERGVLGLEQAITGGHAPHILSPEEADAHVASQAEHLGFGKGQNIPQNTVAGAMMGPAGGSYTAGSDIATPLVKMGLHTAQDPLTYTPERLAKGAADLVGQVLGKVPGATKLGNKVADAVHSTAGYYPHAPRDKVTDISGVAASERAKLIPKERADMEAYREELRELKRGKTVTPKLRKRLLQEAYDYGDADMRSQALEMDPSVGNLREVTQHIAEGDYVTKPGNVRTRYETRDVNGDWHETKRAAGFNPGKPGNVRAIVETQDANGNWTQLQKAAGHEPGTPGNVESDLVVDKEGVPTKVAPPARKPSTQDWRLQQITKRRTTSDTGAVEKVLRRFRGEPGEAGKTILEPNNNPERWSPSLRRVFKGTPEESGQAVYESARPAKWTRHDRAVFEGTPEELIPPKLTPVKSMVEPFRNPYSGKWETPDTETSNLLHYNVKDEYAPLIEAKNGEAEVPFEWTPGQVGRAQFELPQVGRDVEYLPLHKAIKARMAAGTRTIGDRAIVKRLVDEGIAPDKETAEKWLSSPSLTGIRALTRLSDMGRFALTSVNPLPHMGNVLTGAFLGGGLKGGAGAIARSFGDLDPELQKEMLEAGVGASDFQAHGVGPFRHGQAAIDRLDAGTRAQLYVQFKKSHPEWSKYRLSKEVRDFAGDYFGASTSPLVQISRGAGGEFPGWNLGIIPRMTTKGALKNPGRIEQYARAEQAASSGDENVDFGKPVDSGANLLLNPRMLFGNSIAGPAINTAYNTAKFLSQPPAERDLGAFGRTVTSDALEYVPGGTFAAPLINAYHNPDGLLQREGESAIGMHTSRKESAKAKIIQQLLENNPGMSPYLAQRAYRLMFH